MTTTVPSLVLLGFLLGVKHAIEADHVAAVATIVSEQRNLWRSSAVGVLWGAGHTVALLVALVVVLGLRLAIPARLVLFFEFLVGLMLIVLGGRAIGRAARQTRVHRHAHTHGEQTHAHLHVHTGEHSTHDHVHLALTRRSFWVGLLHGLAGSGALTVLVLAAVPSFAAGVAYVLVFGVGSLLGMVVVSMLIGLPIALAGRLGTFHLWIQWAAGALSMVLGGTILWSLLSPVL